MSHIILALTFLFLPTSSTKAAIINLSNTSLSNDNQTQLKASTNATRPSLIITASKRSNQAPRLPNSTFPVEAFDCAQPRNVAPVHVPSPTSCTEDDAPVRAIAQKEASYTLLQKADFIRSTARHCVVRESSLVLYCGAYDHQTLAGPLVELLHNIRIPPHECKELFRTKTWTDTRGTVHPLELNIVNHIYYTHVGSVTMDRWHTGCTGGQITHKGQSLNRMFVGRYRDITLTHEDTTIAEDGAVLLYRSQIRLPLPDCHENHMECVTLTGTYLWHPTSAPQSCRFFAIRNTTGVVVTSNSGEDVYMSTDNSLIRLLLQTSLTECDVPIQATDYDRLFVTDTTNAHRFSDDIHPNEMSIVTYSNAKDSWLYGHLTTFMDEELRRVLRNNCNKMASAAQLQFGRTAAAQTASKAGTTSHLQKDWFATAAGDIWYRYQCRRLVVHARHTNHTCFDSLPVTLNDTDRLLYQRDRNISHQDMKDIQFFMEAHTHLITQHGIPRDCVDNRPSIYKGLNNTWISYGRTLEHIHPPLRLQPEFTPSEKEQRKSPNFEKGGIYTPENVRSMERHRQAPRAITDVVTQLGRKAIQNQWHGTPGHYPTPQDILDGTQGLDYFSWFWDSVSQLGSYASILVGLCILIKIATWFAGCALRFFNHETRNRGILQRLAAAFFPSVVQYIAGINRYRDVRNTHRQQQRPDQNIEQEQLWSGVENEAQFRTRMERLKTHRQRLTTSLPPQFLHSPFNSTPDENQDSLQPINRPFRSSLISMIHKPKRLLTKDSKTSTTSLQLLPPNQFHRPRADTPYPSPNPSTPDLSLIAHMDVGSLRSLILAHIHVADHPEEVVYDLNRLLQRINVLQVELLETPRDAPAIEQNLLQEALTGIRLDLLKIPEVTAMLYRPPP